MLKQFIIATIFCFNSWVFMFCQGIEPQLVFPEKPFENYNCTQFINDSLIISPFHNSVRIYGMESESLILHHTVFLDADPIAITQNARKISIIDWNSVLYILNKEDYRISKKIHLDIPPKELTYIGDELIVLSDSAYLVVKGDSIFESIKVNSYIQGIFALENVMKTITSDCIFLTNNIDSVQKISPIKSSKFKGNTFFNQDAFKVISSIENEIYCVKSDSFFSIPKNMEAVVKVKTSGVNCFLLDSAGVLSTYNLKNNNFLFVSKDVLDFELTDTSLLLLKPNLIILMNLFGTDTLLKIPVPKIYDARRLMAFNHSLLITYSDLSFLFYSFQINKWYRVNEKSGFKGNLLLANDEIICSGDSHVFKYSLTNKRTDLIKDLYTFSTTTQGNILYYGSENNQQRDSLLLQVIDKHDPLNASSIRKVELFLSGLVVHFYNDKLIIICNEKERIILNSSYFEKLSDSEILYENSNNLYYINLESQDEVLLDSNIKTPSISFKLRDNSIVTLGTAGNAKRYYFNSTITSQAFSFPEEYAFSSIFKDQSQGVYLTTWNGYLLKFNEEINQINALYKNNYPLFAGSFNNKYQVLGIVDLQGQVKLFYAKNHTKMLTLFTINNTEKLFVDNHGRFDGTQGAIEKLYFVCGLEVVELSQVKQSLRVRNLVEKILNKEDLSGYKKLSDLNICGKLPLIETIGNQEEFAYTIQRRLAPLIRIEVLLDKKVIKTIDPNTLSWSNNKTTLRLNPAEIRSFFEPGKENKVKVQAIANVDGVEIPDRGVVVTIEDQRERKKPTFYGVFLGVNEYNDESLALNFPVNDALSLSKTMEEGVGALLDPQQVKIYNIHSNYSLEKKNGFGAPTLNTLRRALQEIAGKAEPQDVLFLFLAGHGTMGDNTHKKFTFLTSEATRDAPMGLTTDTLFSWISTEGPFKLKANKAILILDACNSGQLLNDVAVRSDKDEEEQRQRQLDHLSDRSGLFILSAAAPNKSAYEIPKLEHGLLTYSLLRVLKQNNAIYENESYVNMTKWFYETSRDLSKLTEEYKLNQEATPSGTGDFQLLKITKELRQRIKLAEEKQILFFESVENEKEELPDPELKRRLEKKMEINALFRAGFYKTDKYDDQGVLVKIKYSLKGKKIQCRILIFQKSEKQKEVTVSNANGSWETLENDILDALIKWQRH